MSLAIVLLIVLFAVLLSIQVPIAVVLAAVTVVAAWALGYEQVLITIASDMASGPESFTLLGHPVFCTCRRVPRGGGRHAASSTSPVLWLGVSLEGLPGSTP
jgi:hypothetical protein